MTSNSPDIKITETPIRAPSAVPVDDAVLPFEVDALDLRGRLTRLGPALDDILAKHDYPRAGRQAARRSDRADDVARLVPEIQRPLHPADPDRRSGVVSDRGLPGARSLRAYARFDASAAQGGPGFRRAARQGPSRHDHRSGAGHEPLSGPGRAHGGRLEDAAHEYFLRSEQIPTRVRLAVGEEWRGGEGGARHRWRAGGMLLQFLPKAPERARQADLHPGDAPEGTCRTRSPRTTPGSRASR